MKKENLQKLTVSAIMIALSTVLSFVQFPSLWVYGGSITLLSMVPMCLISVMYGTRYAILPCFIYGAIQMAVSGVFGWGLTPATLIGAIALDYLAAFTVLCLAGIFRSKGFGGIIAGTALAVTARFVCHLLSGVIFFQSLEYFNNPLIYSAVYNGSFMLPELILTLAGTFVLYKSKAINKIIK